MSRSSAPRCLLFVPAKERFLAKAASGFEADAAIVDLEDSILERDKDAALERAVGFFASYSGPTPCYVRVDRPRADEEIAALAPFDSVAGFMFPKTEDPDDFAPYAAALDGRTTIALVETPLGMVRLEKIAASERVAALALGAEDLTCAMNAASTFDVLYHARSRIVLYAKAFGKRVYDAPSLNARDPAALRAELPAIADMGFDGKLAIHPAQTASIREAFRRYDPDEIRRTIELFEQSGTGVFEYGGTIYERPHIERLKNVLRSLER